MSKMFQNRWLLAGTLLAGLAAFWTLGDRRPVYGGQPLSVWLETLVSSDYRERHRAEAALRPLGVEAIPDLVRALRVRDRRWKRAWLFVADRMFGTPKPRVPAARLREQAALLLARLGPRAEPAVPGLLEGLADPDPEARRAVQSALRHVGPGSVPGLITALRHRQAAVRAGAAELLGDQQDLGPAVGKAATPLVAALRDRDAGVREQAAGALGQIDTGSERVIGALADLLADPAPPVCGAAARALGQIGPAASPALPRLDLCLAGPDPYLRVEAARAVWRIGRQAGRVTPTLIAGLRDPQVHWQAALALAEVGARAEAAIPALLEALELEVAHRPSRTPASAALALARMSPAAVPGLVRLLGHEKPWVRVGAALALAGHGEEARAAVPSLVRMLEDPDGEARITASNALGAIGGAASAAIPRLVEVAQDSDEYVRAGALAAINRISRGPGGKQPRAPVNLDPANLGAQ
jgi:HEAT repeat protein